MKFKRSNAILGLLLTGAAALGGVVITNDGKRVEGELKKTPDGWRVTQADGKVREIAAADVRAIELTSGASGNQMERLGSLRRSVEAFDDIPKIIERYRRFIEQVKEKAVIDEALADLSVWQDRLDRNLIKFGKHWITAEQKRELLIDLLRRADTARLHIKAGQTREAQTTIDAILEDDPENLSAIYLSGVILQQQEKWPEARKQFDRVREAIPDHAPTLHNLAIINLKQKQWSAASLMIDQALAAAPNVQTLIDAAAEVINAMPDDQKKASAVQKLTKRFSEQDAAMQKAMAAKQLYRWGSKWVDEATNTQLVEAEKAVKKKLDALREDFDLTQNRIDRIDTEISQNDRTIREIESRSYIRTGDGTYIRVPYPSAYYDIQRDNNRLRAERSEMVQRLDALRDSAKRAQADLPVPKFTGVIAAIGEDGVPIVVPEGVDLNEVRAKSPPPPTTQPNQPPPPQPIIRIGPSGDQPM